MKKTRIKYDERTLERATKLYKKGVPIRVIQATTGIKSASTILFRANPEYRKKMIEAGKRWREKNPERWAEICKRSVARARKQKIKS